MKPDLVALRGTVSPALARPNVHQDGAGHLQRGTEDVLQPAPVVTWDNAQIGDAKILEELPWLSEVDDHSPDPA